MKWQLLKNTAPHNIQKLAADDRHDLEPRHYCVIFINGSIAKKVGILICPHFQWLFFGVGYP
jgi:hypothetical protein